MTNQEHKLFQEWFTALNLLDLEDVRDYVLMHTMQNISDVEPTEQLSAAKQTVLFYMDGNQEVFETYRTPATTADLENVKVLVQDAHRNLDDEELEEVVQSMVDATQQERQDWIETMAESYESINATELDVQMFLDYFIIKFDL